MLRHAREIRESLRRARTAYDPRVTRYLTDDAIARYREQGFLELGALLDPADCKALCAEEERFRPPPAPDYPGLRVAVQLCDRSEPVRRIATRGPQIAPVVQLLGPDVCLTHVQYVTKLPDPKPETSDIPWHQDSGYGELQPADEDVTVFFALTDMDERNGCLQVSPGSHRLGLQAHGPSAAHRYLQETAVTGSRVSVPLRAGEALAFSGLLLHGSGPNRSDAPRRVFYTRYCTPRVRMMSEGGRPVLDDPQSWMVAGEA